MGSVRGEGGPGGEAAQIPVSVLSGFLGSGKTTLLKHVLQNQHGMKVAVVVNDMAELNVDAHLVSRDRGHGIEKMIEMQNGCICCTLRDELLVQIRDLALSKKYDYIMIESTGVAEPLGVAESFTMEVELPETPGEFVPLAELAKLDCLITVVDAVNFPMDSTTEEMASDRWKDTDERDDQNIAFLLIDQIEFANVVVINKIDQVSPEAVAQLEKIVRKLNSKALILKTSYSRIPLEQVLNTGRFSFEEAQAAPGWLQSLKEPDSQKVPETEEYGISSFVYRRRRPFHPERLLDVLEKMTSRDMAAHVVRSKGFIWLASRNDMYGDLSQAGALATINPGGAWFACMNRAVWETEYSTAAVNAEFLDGIGDRRQEIVIIGKDLRRAEVEAMLDSCLLTDEEFALGESVWKTYKDDFDPWVDDEDDEDDHEDGHEDGHEGGHEGGHEDGHEGGHEGGHENGHGNGKEDNEAGNHRAHETEQKEVANETQDDGHTEHAHKCKHGCDHENAAASRKKPKRSDKEPR